MLETPIRRVFGYSLLKSEALEGERDERSRLEHALEQGRLELEALTAKFEAERADLLKAQERLEARLANTRADVDALIARRDQVKEQLKAAAAAKDALSAERDALVKAQKRMESQIEGAGVQLQEMRARRDELKDRVKAMGSDRDAQFAERKQMAKDLAGERSRHAELNEKLTGLREGYAELKGQLKVQTQARAYAENQLAKEKSRLESRVAEQGARLEDAAERREQLKQLLAQAQGGYEAARKDADHAGKELAAERTAHRKTQNMLREELVRRERLMLEFRDGGGVSQVVVWRDLARSRGKAADADGEISAWARVLEIEPENREALERTGELKVQLGRPAEAVPHLRLLAELPPARALKWGRLARVLEDAGDPAGAVDAWRQVAELSPGEPKAIARLAQLLQYDLDRKTDAVPYLKALADMAPEDPEPLKRLAEALEETGEAEASVEAWRRVLKLAADDRDANEHLGLLLYNLGRDAEAGVHLKAIGLELPGRSAGKISSIDAGSRQIFFEQDGKIEKVSYTYYRGEHTNFYPKDDSLKDDRVISTHMVRGLTPQAPLFDERSWIVAFGSCFAAHVSDYLYELGYNVATKQGGAAYVSRMGDGIVNSFAIRQQFEWAWNGKKPEVDLWHGYDAKALGYDEDVRLATRQLFDQADAFIITLGLSEVWYDEPTGEVFWRAVPMEYFDPTRHKFRVTSHAENLENLRAIHAMIREHRPDATIIFTLSPIPLTATFRPVPCIVADAVSKAVLRAALDEFYRGAQDEDANLYYFPSYEIALRCFDHPYMEDRRHVHKHVLDLNMAVFERFYCRTGMTDQDLLERFRTAQALDEAIVREGHWAAPRKYELHHRPAAPVAVNGHGPALPAPEPKPTPKRAAASKPKAQRRKAKSPPAQAKPA
jgi:Flp pilus assembly protein TadD/predicted  nucleic acid-binding Zn-ribbon protein